MPNTTHRVLCRSFFTIALSLTAFIISCSKSCASPYQESNVVPTQPAISAADARQHVTFLASERLAGRATASEGERLWNDYVANIFKNLDLKSYGSKDGYFHEFEFVAGVSLGASNQLLRNLPNNSQEQYELNKDWRPLSFSNVGKSSATEIIFAGYGLIVAKTNEFDEYNSYTHLDVKDKFVMLFRFVPEHVPMKLKQHLNRYAELRRKAMLARDLGAKGVIVVSGPNSRVNEDLIKLEFDATLGGTSIFALSITDRLADNLLQDVNKTIKELQDELDQGKLTQGFSLGKQTLDINVDIIQEKRIGKNVIGRLELNNTPSEQTVFIGAHGDHLGKKESQTGGGTGPGQAAGTYYGADDNASGVSAVLEIAQYLAHQKTAGLLTGKRDLVFCIWSGEELGLLGSSAFVNSIQNQTNSIYPSVAAYLNMDMIGRLNKQLILQGVGSSPDWQNIIETLPNKPTFELISQTDPYLPTDSTQFYIKGSPILNGFTGSHEDYHTPNDTADKINYEGIEQVAKFVTSIAENLSQRQDPPSYQKVEQPGGGGARFRVYLGTIPDYSNTSVKGVLLAGVKPNSPAEKAGLKANDIIIELAEQKIENIYDYTYVLSALRAGEEVTIVIKRDSETLQLKITPESRS